MLYYIYLSCMCSHLYAIGSFCGPNSGYRVWCQHLFPLRHFACPFIIEFLIKCQCLWWFEWEIPFIGSGIWIWCTVGDTAWGDCKTLGIVALLKEVCQWGRHWRCVASLYSNLLFASCCTMLSCPNGLCLSGATQSCFRHGILLHQQNSYKPHKLWLFWES